MRRKMQRNIWIAAVIIGLLATVLLGAVRIHTLKREKEETQQRLEHEVQQGIAKEIFRLHVVANSDTDEDQNLKLHVKTRIVDYLEDVLGEDRSLEATKEGVLTHLNEIEDTDRPSKRKGMTTLSQPLWKRRIFLIRLTGTAPFPPENMKP